jgi:hypothetical protein
MGPTAAAHAAMPISLIEVSRPARYDLEEYPRNLG